MSYQSRNCGPHGNSVVHHLVSQHSVEIEVWPAEAEVYFADERFIDPVNSQVRFDATVYNAPNKDVQWEVHDIAGGPGAGSIDPSGLYVAPPKGMLPHGTTDIVVATVVADSARTASARVTLIGFGPAPQPVPKVQIFPKQIYLYYPGNESPTVHNEYIDVSNTRQLFRATIRNSATTQVRWSLDSGMSYVGDTQPWYLYNAPGSGSTGTVIKIRVELDGQPEIYDEAQIVMINYIWPGNT